MGQAARFCGVRVKARSVDDPRAAAHARQSSRAHRRLRDGPSAPPCRGRVLAHVVPPKMPSSGPTRMCRSRIRVSSSAALQVARRRALARSRRSAGVSQASVRRCVAVSLMRRPQGRLRRHAVEQQGARASRAALHAAPRRAVARSRRCSSGQEVDNQPQGSSRVVSANLGGA